ncbi:hypothetical protein H8D85_01600 [bacterium]|nr:hypothetical protein [bacterium]
MNKIIINAFATELKKLAEKDSWGDASKKFTSSSTDYTDLNSAVKYRGTLEKGSDKYLAVQKDINASFGKTNKSPEQYKSTMPRKTVSPKQTTVVDENPTSEDQAPTTKKKKRFNIKGAFSNILKNKKDSSAKGTDKNNVPRISYTGDTSLEDFDPVNLSKLMGRMEGYGVKGSRASRNFNPGNLKFMKQRNASLSDGGFAKFENEAQGYQALVNQINLDASPERNHTLSSFLHKYAPSSENDTSNYEKFILNESNKSV